MCLVLERIRHTDLFICIFYLYLNINLYANITFACLALNISLPLDLQERLEFLKLHFKNLFFLKQL